MIVEVKCDNGHVLATFVNEHLFADGLHIYSKDYTCPTCNPPEPSYGPLTVDEVAIALFAKHSPNKGVWIECVDSEKERFRRQARMVIRAMREINGHRHNNSAQFYDDPLAWLLGLDDEA